MEIVIYSNNVVVIMLVKSVIDRFPNLHKLGKSFSWVVTLYITLGFWRLIDECNHNKRSETMHSITCQNAHRFCKNKKINDFMNFRLLNISYACNNRKIAQYDDFLFKEKIFSYLNSSQRFNKIRNTITVSALFNEYN